MRSLTPEGNARKRAAAACGLPRPASHTYDLEASEYDYAVLPVLLVV